MSEIDTNNALIFSGPVLPQGMKFRGNASLQLNVLAEQGSQYFVYFVEVDPTTNVASWVSHAPYSTLQRDGSVLAAPELMTIDINTYWIAHDIKPGNYLALIIDSKDFGYVQNVELPETSTIVLSDTTQSTLTLQSLKSNSPNITLNTASTQQLDCPDDNPTDLRLGAITQENSTSNNGLSIRKRGSLGLFFVLILSILVTTRWKYIYCSRSTSF